MLHYSSKETRLSEVKERGRRRGGSLEVSRGISGALRTANLALLQDVFLDCQRIPELNAHSSANGFEQQRISLSTLTLTEAWPVVLSFILYFLLFDLFLRDHTKCLPAASTCDPIWRMCWKIQYKFITPKIKWFGDSLRSAGSVTPKVV